MSASREYSPRRFATGSVSCPSCRAKLRRDASSCGACGFVGQESMHLFGADPPPLLPILDVADLWDDRQRGLIENSVRSFKKHFPQLDCRVCAVALDPDVKLPIFGFWLMNVCPLMPGETQEQREWTILLLVDGNSGRAAVTTGYRAEVWLSDEMWNHILVEPVALFARGRPAKAVSLFLEKARKHLDQAWERAMIQIEPREAS